MAGKKDVKKELEKVADKMAATEIEVKKTVRKAARTAKEAVEAAAQSDAAVAAQIEVKKATRKAARKVKEAVETGVEETKKVMRRAQLNIIIQSPMGGSISTDAIADKIDLVIQLLFVNLCRIIVRIMFFIFIADADDDHNDGGEDKKDSESYGNNVTGRNGKRDEQCDYYDAADDYQSPRKCFPFFCAEFLEVCDHLFVQFILGIAG